MVDLHDIRTTRLAPRSPGARSTPFRLADSIAPDLLEKQNRPGITA
jgi:hypothetical protein